MVAFAFFCKIPWSTTPTSSPYVTVTWQVPESLPAQRLLNMRACRELSRKGDSVINIADLLGRGGPEGRKSDNPAPCPTPGDSQIVDSDFYSC
jgi:hypothetical protein